LTAICSLHCPVDRCLENSGALLLLLLLLTMMMMMMMMTLMLVDIRRSDHSDVVHGGRGVCGWYQW